MKVFKMYKKLNVTNEELSIIKVKIQKGNFELIALYNYMLNERRVK